MPIIIRISGFPRQESSRIGPHLNIHQEVRTLCLLRSASASALRSGFAKLKSRLERCRHYANRHGTYQTSRRGERRCHARSALSRCYEDIAHWRAESSEASGWASC